MKKLSFYFLSIFFLIFFILLTDFILSNTVLNYKNCFKYEKFYYELKKNCAGKYRFKKTFPIVETITDDMGLRIGKDSLPKNKDKKNIFIFGDSFTYGVGIEYEKTFAGLLEKKDLPNYIYTPTLSLVEYVKSLNVPVICFPREIKNYKEFCDIVKPDAISIDYNVDPKKILRDIFSAFKNSTKVLNL